MEIKIPKEVRQHKETIFFGLSARQFACSVLAVGIAVGVYFLTKNLIGQDTASWVCMLWRYSGSPAATNKELHFNDTDEISGFALEALRWAVENGIMGGYGDGRLGPQGQATRAQVAQMLKNYIENLEENT